MKTKILPDDRIITITGRIRKLYFVIMCLGTLNVIFALPELSESLPRREILQDIIGLSLCLVMYLGLRLRKEWLIPLVLIYSAWLLISTFLTAFQPAVDVPGLLVKAGGIVIVLFCAYQLHFFSRREVKSYFGTKEVILF